MDETQAGEANSTAASLAKWSLGLSAASVASILFFAPLVILAVPGVVCGHIANARLDPAANPRESRLALMGLLLGYSTAATFAYLRFV